MHIPIIYQKVLPVQGDLEKEEDVKALLDATIKHFGKLHILVSTSLQYSNFHYCLISQVLFSLFSNHESQKLSGMR